MVQSLAARIAGMVPDWLSSSDSCSSSKAYSSQENADVTTAAPDSRTQVVAVEQSDVEIFVPQRLEAAGLDSEYIRVAHPEIQAALDGACRTCSERDRCRGDFAHSDANERLAAYCPNTAAIDALVTAKSI